MRTKEEYYELVKQNRAIVSDPANRACPCPKSKCEWHDKCAECVALHRFNAEHVPNCFQPFIKEKITSLAVVAELETVDKEMTPLEYWDYVRERDHA